MTELLIIFVCLSINALFSCFEMAFVTVGKPQLRHLARTGNRAASHLLRLRQDPERTLSVVQVGITLVGMISAAAGGAGAEESLSPLIEARFAISEHAAEAVAITLVVLPLTLLNVVFGELIPKAVALRNPILVSTYGVRAVTVIDRLFAPVVWLLEITTKSFLAFFPQGKASAHVDHVASVDIDHLSNQTQQYVLNLIGIEQRRVSDVMVAWDKVDSVARTNTRQEVAAVVVRSGHTRLPVIDENGGVVGLLHTKEFIATFSADLEDWTANVRPVIDVSANVMALRALKLMQERKTHMAVVTHDGKPLGVVTMEDVLEEIVGEIYDEDDDGRVRKLIAGRAQRRGRS